MTDRELLKLAALAAGIRIDKSETNGGGVGNDGFCVTGDAMLDWHNNIRWNPLTDDGDALRLAADLRLGLEWGMATVRVDCCVERYCDGDDPRAVARRAIVRAAAAIGKAMQQEHRRTTP